MLSVTLGALEFFPRNELVLEEYSDEKQSDYVIARNESIILSSLLEVAESEQRYCIKSYIFQYLILVLSLKEARGNTGESVRMLRSKPRLHLVVRDAVISVRVHFTEDVWRGNHPLDLLIIYADNVQRKTKRCVRGNIRASPLSTISLLRRDD